LNVRDIFIGDASSRYWFNKGYNLRAIVVTFVSLLPCLPSFAASIAPKKVNLSQPVRNMFYISFVLTWTLAALLYWGSYYVFPEKSLAVNEKTLRFEQWADDLDSNEKELVNVQDIEEGTYAISEDDEKAAEIKG